LVINFKEELESSKINFVPYMIDYADFWTGLSHQSIQIELTEIKNKIVFDKQKPFLQAQSEINKIIK
jgi:hypothetical protein